MRKGLIIFIIVVLAAGSLAGVVFYRKNAQKDAQLAEQLEQIEALKKKISKLDQDATGFQQQSAANQKRIKSLEDEKQHVVQLEKVLKEKDEALATAQKESDALKASMRDLEVKLKYEQESLQSQGEKLQTAQAQIENLTTEFENTIRSRTDLETQVAKLKDQQNKNRTKFHELEEKLKDTSQLLDASTQEIESIKRIRNDLALKLEKERTEKHTLEKELAQTHDNITRDQIEFQNKQNELEAAQSQIVSLTGLVEQTKAELADISNQLSILKPEKAKLEAEVSGLKTQIRDLSKVRLADQVAYQNRQRELEAAQSRIVNLQQEIQKNEKIKAILKEKVSDFKTQILGLKEAYRRIQTLQKEIEKTANINLSLKNQISILQIQLNDYQTKTRNFKTTIEEKEISLKQLITNLNNCLVSSKDVETSIKSAQSQIIGLTGMVEQAQAEQAAMSDRVSTLETEKAELKKRVSGLTTQIRTIKKDRYEDQLAFQNKQKDLEAAQSEIVNLQQEIQKNKEVKAVLEEKVSGLTTQVLDLKDAHNRMLELQKEIQQTTKLNLSLKNLISILQIQLNNYKENTLNFEDTIEERETQLKQIVTNLKNCLVSSKDVESSLQSAQSQIIGLTGMVEQARAEQVVMSKQVSNLESEKTEMALKLTEVKKTYDILIRELHDKIESKEAVINDFEKKFSVTFVDRVIFHSGKAIITTTGQGVLKKAGDILSKMRFGVIRIAGHTDNVPIRRGWRGRFPTNWELSSARAAAVARFFQKESNISPENIEVVGFGEHQPIASNTTREGRAKNRRVEITIAPMGSSVRSAP